MGYFGIDFGMTNCCLARYDEQLSKAVVVPNIMENSNMLPAAVAFDPPRPYEAVIGRAAKDVMDYSPTTGAAFVKRYMGANDVYPLTTPDGHRLSPQDVSALILRQIKAYGEVVTGETIDEVVVSVPVYYCGAERGATMRAVETAGMKLKSLITDPMAVTLSYFENYAGDDPCTVLVYDQGGDTFDVSVVRIRFDPDGTQDIKILTFDGDRHLGGLDWDARLYELVQEKVEETLAETNPDIVLTFEDEQEIQRKIEPLKKRLSDTESSVLRMSLQGTRVAVTVTRAEFEAVTTDLLERTCALCEGVLTHPCMAGVTVDKVLMAGGSSNMPMVQEMLRSVLPGVEILVNEPELAHAKGCCIAGYLYDAPTKKIDFMSILRKLDKGEDIYLRPQEHHFGISLGATESSIAVYDERGKCGVSIVDPKGPAMTVPSVIAFDPDENDSPRVGQDARQLLIECPRCGVECVKRILETENTVLTTPGGYVLTPEEACALILRKLRNLAMQAHGESVTEVTVTVPAWYGNHQRRALTRAAELAGMRVKSMVSDPVAITLAYYANFNPGRPETALVYDLGGSSFEVSVVRLYCNDNDTQRVEILTSEGDHRLGGEDWDGRLYKILVDKVRNFLEAEGCREELTREDLAVIRRRTEDIRQCLSVSDSAKLRMRVDDRRVSVSVTRAELEAATADLLDRTRALCMDMLANPVLAGVTVDRVLLGGGGSLMPMVRRMVEEMMPEDTWICIAEPHLAPAKGACIAGYMMDVPGREPPEPPVPGPLPLPFIPVEEIMNEDPVECWEEWPKVIPVVPQTIGIRLYDRERACHYIRPKIIRGTPLVDGRLVVDIDDFAVPRNGMTKLRLALFRISGEVDGERIDVDWADGGFHMVNPDNNPLGIGYLGELVVYPAPGVGEGSRLHVTMEVNMDGLNVVCSSPDAPDRVFEMSLWGC